MHKALVSGLLGSLLCFFLISPPAQATVLLGLSDKELVERSAVVVQGTVVGQQAVWIEGRLWTDTQVRVTRRIKGPEGPGATVVMRQPGGETPAVGVRVSGAATFRPGEAVVVFGRPVGQVYVVVGMAMGKFRVVKDKQGRLQAQRDLGGVAFARFDAQGKMTVVPPVKTGPVPLETLVRTVRALGGGR